MCSHGLVVKVRSEYSLLYEGFQKSKKAGTLKTLLGMPVRNLPPLAFLLQKCDAFGSIPVENLPSFSIVHLMEFENVYDQIVEQLPKMVNF